MKERSGKQLMKSDSKYINRLISCILSIHTASARFLRSIHKTKKCSCSMFAVILNKILYSYLIIYENVR